MEELFCTEKKRRVQQHVVAIPYPAQGHIVPLMQLCKKLAREEGFMVTFVNTEHNHARMIQAQAGVDLVQATSGGHIQYAAEGTEGDGSDEEKMNIRLVGIPGGLPPELHGDPDHVVAAFKASEALSDPFDKLLDKLARDGEPATCIISDVLMSGTQACADRLGIPRVAFWTSSAAVYHVIWHMYGLIKQGMPTFKAANTVFEDNNTEMVSCIPGLPPMDLNDLPIIVRSDPADFIYQFLTRQLSPMGRAAAVLINTFWELEEDCLQALPANFPVPAYAIGPLLPPEAAAAAAANGSLLTDGEADGEIDKQLEFVQHTQLYCTASEEHVAASAGAATLKPAAPHRTHTIAAAFGNGSEKMGAAKSASRFSNSGIFSEDKSCLEWLDKKESRSVLYISFGSIFSMSPEQFTELLEGLQASQQAFLWAIRPGFVQGCGSYASLLPPSFRESTKERGLLVSWVPQLSVLAHPAIAGFLTHCGWNSTLESLAFGIPMLCWPDVGERRTNGRLAVSMWGAGLEFACSVSSHTSALLIAREEVTRVILKLMGPCSRRAGGLRTKAASLQLAACKALSQGGSSSQAWSLFLARLQHPQQP